MTAQSAPSYSVQMPPDLALCPKYFGISCGVIVIVCWVAGRNEMMHESESWGAKRK